MSDLILSPREYRLLEGLRLNPRKSFIGRVRGERVTKRTGISIEFADYRDYTEGDDLRHLDWNVLARLDTPIVKTYQDEEDLAVHLLVDLSPSMNFGDPTKLESSKKLAASLGYIALAAGDAVYLRQSGQKAVPIRSRAGYPKLARSLNHTVLNQNFRVTDILRTFAKEQNRPGVVVLLSDGWDPEICSALRLVAGRGHEIHFLQVLTVSELNPDMEGDLRLVDAEGGVPREITANRDTLIAYKQNVAHHNAEIEATCLAIGARYHQVKQDETLESIVKNVWKRQGWVV